MHSRIPVLLSLCLSLVAAPATAQDERFAGRWWIVSAAPAPWLDISVVFDAKEAESYLGDELVFAADRVEGPAPLGCANAVYETAMSPPEGLFQGSLDAETAVTDGASLGIAGETPTLRVSCDTGVFDYHLAGDELLTALNNVIYTLARDP